MNKKEFLKKTLECIILCSIPLISSCSKNPVSYKKNDCWHYMRKAC